MLSFKSIELKSEIQVIKKKKSSWRLIGVLGKILSLVKTFFNKKKTISIPINTFIGAGEIAMVKGMRIIAQLITKLKNLSIYASFF